MTTLRHRATPEQLRIMRAVDGAVRNVAHHHPEWIRDTRAAGSIAKRAAGTLTAPRREALASATQAPSDSEGGNYNRPRTSGFKVRHEAAGARQTFAWRAPFYLLHRAIGAAAGDARRCGEHVRAKALIDVLRAIASVIQDPKQEKVEI